MQKMGWEVIVMVIMVVMINDDDNNMLMCSVGRKRNKRICQRYRDTYYVV